MLSRQVDTVWYLTSIIIQRGSRSPPIPTIPSTTTTTTPPILIRTIHFQSTTQISSVDSSLNGPSSKKEADGIICIQVAGRTRGVHKLQEGDSCPRHCWRLGRHQTSNRRGSSIHLPSRRACGGQNDQRMGKLLSGMYLISSYVLL